MSSPSESRAEPNAEPRAASGATQRTGVGDATLVEGMPGGRTGSDPGPAAVTGPGATLGPYRLVEKLGEGGMGAVWKAIHVRLEKTVALKLLPTRLLADTEAVARFGREMKAAGRVAHPNVVQAFDAGEAGGLHYLAMEYVEGTDLHRFVGKRGPLSPQQSAGVVRQAALGLAAAHAAGMVHRDVKPQNLLISKDGRVKLLDLGLARLAEEASAGAAAAGLTADGQVMGTPDYMAPEQWEDSHAAGTPADLYALGCTLHFLLTGKPPFATAKHSTVARKMQAHLAEPAPSLRAARPEVPGELDALCARLLAKKPTDRPKSAAEVAAALKAYMKPGDPDKATALPDVITPTSAAPSPAAGFPDFETSPVALASPRRAATAVKPEPARGQVPPGRNKWLLLAAGGGFLGLLGLIFALTIRVGGATLRIEGLDPEMSVTVTQGGKRVEILDQKTGAKAELDPGTYELTLTGAGLSATLTQNLITLSRGDEKVVEIVPGSRDREEEAASDGIGPAANAEAFALRFDGTDDEVRTPVELGGKGDFTIEAWVTPDEPQQFATVLGSAWVALRTAHIPAGGSRWHGVLGATEKGREGHVGWANQAFVKAGARSHVALVRRGGGVRVYVGGRGAGHTIAFGDVKFLDASFAVPPGLLRLGSDAGKRPFAGVIDEVRISDLARYEADFEPAARFEPDHHTVALYHLDEGQGAATKDASGHGHDATIVGAAWVTAAGEDVGKDRDDTRPRRRREKKAAGGLGASANIEAPEAGDPDRDAAHWALSLGAKAIEVEAGGKVVAVKSEADLPPATFHVTQLDLAGRSAVRDDDLARVARLRALRQLTLDRTGVSDAGVARLAGLPNLETLGVLETKVTGIAFRDFPASSPLRTLTLNVSDATPADLEAVGRLSRLDRATFEGFDAKDLPLIAGLPLKYLRLGHGRVGDDDIAAIRRAFPNLHELALTGTAVTDAGLKHLERWASLSQLGLAETAVSDAGLASLKSQPLRYLFLGDTKVTDTGLAEVAGVVTLQHLQLDGLNVTDAGLGRLHALGRLQQLALSRTKVTARGVAAFQAAVPNCHVVWGGKPGG